MKFQKKLKHAIYDLGFINVPVACESAISSQTTFPMKIYLGHTKNIPITTRGNRTAMQNKTPRITGGPMLAAWLQEYFNRDDVAEFEILSPSEIICHLPNNQSDQSNASLAILDDPTPQRPQEGKTLLSAVENYLNHRHPIHRYSSWDYCFNYFRSFKNKKEIADPDNLEKSCLHIGFYLASWGIFGERVSSFKKASGFTSH